MISFLFRREPSAPSSQLPVPLKLWYKDEVSRDQLRQILKAPGLQKAVATLRELALPTAASVKTSQEESARREAWLAGYCDFVRDLEKLATDVPAAHREEEWGWIQTPQEPSYRNNFE